MPQAQHDWPYDIIAVIIRFLHKAPANMCSVQNILFNKIYFLTYYTLLHALLIPSSRELATSLLLEWGHPVVSRM